MSSGFPSPANLFGTPPSALGSQSPNLPYPNPFLAYGQLQSQRIKLKRTRQRVDAGEPRNTYSAIPNFTAVRGGMPGTTNSRFGTPPQMFQTPSPGSGMVDQLSRLFGGYDPNSQAAQNFAASLMPGAMPPSAMNSWFRNHPEETQKSPSGQRPDVSSPMTVDVDQPPQQQQQRDQQPTINHGHVNASVKIENGNHDGDGAGNPCKACDENGVKTTADRETGTEAGPEEEEKDDQGKDLCAHETSSSVGGDQDPLSMSPVESKKARVENIINHISGPSSPSQSIPEEKGSGGSNSEPNSKNSSPKSRRKQYQPQQVEEGLGEEEFRSPTEQRADDEEEKETEGEKKDAGPADPTKMTKALLNMQQQFYFDWLTQQQQLAKDASAKKLDENEEMIRRREPEEGIPVKIPKLSTDPAVDDKHLKTMAQNLKSELITAVTSTVEKMFADYVTAEAARRAQQRLRESAEQAMNNQPRPATSQSAAPRQFYNPFYPYPYSGGGFGMMPTSAAPGTSIFPGFSNPYLNHPGLGGGAGTPLHRKDDSYSLVMPRKKRSKVTDTRLTKMPLRGDESCRESPTGYFPPTMVGHPLYGATFPGLEDRDIESPTGSDDPSELGPFDPHTQSTTLTPMHLRKAKLMFFYTRYPSSQLLKSYFPDIHFKKETTAQLVKWFSNFREFYYIQMEKYARQALAEGIRRPEDVHVTLDSEIYKVLNQHYNRNNHIPVPPKYREVVEATLREFFVSIQNGKDAEASWKKQIYKVIARLDDTIPDYFKNPNFLDQLE